MNSFKKRVRAELYLRGVNAKAFFGLLNQQKEAIERELGYQLEWEASYLDGVDTDDKADWPRQHEWLAKHLNDSFQWSR
jgi:hypothetical protein